MGNLFSKETPQKFGHVKNIKNLSIPEISEADEKMFDPRSPTLNIIRTPIVPEIVNRDTVKITRNIDLTTEFETPQKFGNDNIFKIKLLRNLGYNLNDPRSPSMFINRTPLNLREEMPKHSINENITNPSVEFVEVQESFNELDSFESALSSMCDELTQSFDDHTVSLETAPEKYLETNFEYIEEIVKEEIIPYENEEPQKDSSITDKSVEEYCDNVIDNEINDMINEVINELKEMTNENKNKHKVNESNIPKFDKKQKIVFEDLENQNVAKKSTPKKLNLGILNPQIGSKNRTPLSCVANKSHIRSKSTESTQKQKNFLGKISSLDDTSIILASRMYDKNLNNDENTPQRYVENNLNDVITKSKSRIPISHRIPN